MDNTKQLYLNLMKSALTYSLWPEPMREVRYSGKPPIKRFILWALVKLLGKKNIHLVQERGWLEDKKADGIIAPMYGETMIGHKRLDNIQHCIESVLADGIEGDLIETGVWRGGACIFMRALIAAHGITDRKVYVADSFEGLPKPSEAYPADKDAKFHLNPLFRVSLDQVKDNFRKYGLLDDQVEFIPGWFQNTLPHVRFNQFAVLRLDGDMYESTMIALYWLYPKLSVGGYCIIDDYALSGCRQAVDDYRRNNRIVEPINEIDWTGIYWRKQ